MSAYPLLYLKEKVGDNHPDTEGNRTCNLSLPAGSGLNYDYSLFRNHRSSMPFKLPESILVVIYTLDSQVLMLERADPRGFWQSVTGSLHEGESALAAARRELEEETGLVGESVDTGLSNSFPIIPAWRARYAPGVTHNHETVFALQLDSVCEVRLNPDEHVSQLWLPRRQAAAKVSSWTNRDAILALVPDSLSV